MQKQSIHGCTTRPHHRIISQRLCPPPPSAMLIKLDSHDGRHRRQISHVTSDANRITSQAQLAFTRQRMTVQPEQHSHGHRRFGYPPYREVLCVNRGNATGMGDVRVRRRRVHYSLYAKCRPVKRRGMDNHDGGEKGSSIRSGGERVGFPRR